MRRMITTALGKAVCVVVLASMLAGISLPVMTPVRIQPAQAQFGEIWLAIQVGFGAIKLTKDLFSVAKYFLGPDPTAEAMELIEQQEEQLEAMIEQEAEISDEIGAITAKLEYNNLTQEANNQIAAITVAYNQLKDIVANGYDFYKDDKTPLTEYSRNVILPMNSMETAAEAFYQSLVVHPPGSPNCALQQARDIALDELNGLSSSSDFSTTVESTNGVGIVAERPMYFAYEGMLDGGSCQSGMKSPGTEFYFAEGTVRPGFHTFVCVLNPAAQDAAVRMTYMKGDGVTQEQVIQVPAHSRATVNVNSFMGPLDGQGADFSLKVEGTNGVGIVAERPMYFNYNGAWAGGHVSAGVPSPAARQFLAEGTTRPGFDSYICIQNPEERDADVLITYMKGDGSSQQQELVVPASSRRTVKVNDVIGQYDSEACDFSALVECTNGAGLVVERPMYFSYQGRWNGGHCQGGVTEPSGKHFFAEGTRRPGFDTYLCIQNPDDREAEVQVTYMKGDGQTQVQQVKVPARTRKTITCSQAVQGTSLISSYQNNLEKLFKNSWLYQLMAAECVTFARDYDPVTYGLSDDYMTNYYNRYMKMETEMFLACTEQLVMSQVDLSGLGRTQKGIFNLPTDAQQVLTRADELAQLALGEGVPVLNSDGVVTDLNLGLNGRMIASRDIVPADTTPPAVSARLQGGSTLVPASQTELIPLPWLSDTHALMSYDCWTGAAPYNTLTLDNTWSLVRYRFDDLQPGTYDILDAGGTAVSKGIVTRSSGTNPDDPSETYSLTFGEFDTILNTRGGPAILLDPARWTAPAPTKSGALRESDSNHLQSLQDAATGALGMWMYGTGGDHYTTYTYDQENRLERTITAGADMDICAHYTISPRTFITDINGEHYDDKYGFVQGDITIKPSHYKVTAAYELGITDLGTGEYVTLYSDSTSCEDDTADYDNKSHFDYDNRTSQNSRHLIAGHQYKFTFKLKGHHYLDTHDNSNMWAKLNQKVLLDGLRVLGF